MNCGRDARFHDRKSRLDYIASNLDADGIETRDSVALDSVSCELICCLIAQIYFRDSYTLPKTAQPQP